MASRAFPVWAETASSLIVTFRKAVVLDCKGDGMLVEVELSFARGRSDQGAEVDVEVSCNDDSQVASTRLTSLSLELSSWSHCLLVVGLGPRETIVR
jgi:hypothetical protein